MLSFLQISLNNLITSISFAPNEFAYGFWIRDIVRLLINLPPKNLNRLRFIKREKVDNAITFTNTIIKTRYNNIHKIININEKLSIYLRLHYSYSIFNINPKLFNQKVGPFKVLKKVGDLTYKLNLLNNIHIYLVISIIQLKPKTDINLYRKTILSPPSIEKINSNNPDLTTRYSLYKINTLLKRRGTETNIKYLIN